MASDRILVTGGTGFTGGHLCERLVRDGYRVRALVRCPERAHHLRRWGVDVVAGDLLDTESLAQAVDKIDVVYHLAALFRPENVSRLDMWRVNAQGTQDLLDVSVRAGVQRFVHCSTVGVHGDVKRPPATEAAPYGPGDAYQDAKTAGEQVVLRYRDADRLPIVVFRPAGIYGPRDLRFLKLFKAIQKRTFIMLGAGEILYQLIYIDDLIDGVLRCGAATKALGEVFILTGDEPLTLNALVHTMAETLEVPKPRRHFPVLPVYIAGALCEGLCKPFGIQPPLYRRRVDFFRKSRAFDTSKAKATLGFHPKIDLKTGIQLTADWYRREGLL